LQPCCIRLVNGSVWHARALANLGSCDRSLRL
jgi:hypothetical protein